MNELDQVKLRVSKLEELLNQIVFSDRYLFQRDIQMLDGRNVQLARGTGTMIATDTDQKLGFFGEPPVVQQASITSPSGGATVDSQSRTAITSVISTLRTFGFIA